MPRRILSRLDDRDRRILAILQEDGRLTWATLARRMGMSAPAILARVRRLEEGGYIRKYVALLNRHKVGKHVVCYVTVSLTQHDPSTLEQFEQEVGRWPEVLECARITGDGDYLLKVITKDAQELEHFLAEKLGNVPAVDQVRTTFVLREVKYETALSME
ncbi:MAG: Lrp/AsnC family transcriptional regulator [Ardenticatenia bacterium]|nr:Lrp/AsnC family transcriptional regulator [Ardenticatenia bacterium]